MKLHLTVPIVASVLSSSAWAQPRLDRGTHELSVHISPDFEGAIGDILVAQGGYGWFARDGFSLRGTLLYAVLEDVAGDDSDYRTSELGVAGQLHFNRGGVLVPFAGIGIGWRSSHFGDFEEAALVYGPRIGIALFVADNVALDLEATYKLAADDVFINDFVAEDTDLSTTIGLRVLF
jgi:hypothetical protein